MEPIDERKHAIPETMKRSCESCTCHDSLYQASFSPTLDDPRVKFLSLHSSGTGLQQACMGSSITKRVHRTHDDGIGIRVRGRCYPTDFKRASLVGS